MSGMRGLNRTSDSQLALSPKTLTFSHRGNRLLDAEPKIHAISPTVDRLMRLIEGSECVQEQNATSNWRSARQRMCTLVFDLSCIWQCDGFPELPAGSCQFDSRRRVLLPEHIPDPSISRINRSTVGDIA